MSTRSTAHFRDEYGLAAVVYRHYDGYPEAAGRDIHRFLDAASTGEDDRFDDPSMLAARYVVWLAGEFGGSADNLGFTGVRILPADPSDTEYRYVVDCRGPGRPAVSGYHDNGEPVAVPGAPNAPHDVIVAAADRGHTLRFDYTSADGSRTRRRVAPSGVTTNITGVTLVTGVDLDANEPRTFRLDRILYPIDVGVEVL